MNLYAYVGNDPGNAVDPWGLTGELALPYLWIPYAEAAAGAANGGGTTASLAMVEVATIGFGTTAGYATVEVAAVGIGTTASLATATGLGAYLLTSYAIDDTWLGEGGIGDWIYDIARGKDTLCFEARKGGNTGKGERNYTGPGDRNPNPDKKKWYNPKTGKWEKKNPHDGKWRPTTPPQ